MAWFPAWISSFIRQSINQPTYQSIHQPFSLNHQSFNPSSNFIHPFLKPSYSSPKRSIHPSRRMHRYKKRRRGMKWRKRSTFDGPLTSPLTSPPTCYYPEELRGQVIYDLKKENFKCRGGFSRINISCLFHIYSSTTFLFIHFIYVFFCFSKYLFFKNHLKLIV